MKVSELDGVDLKYWVAKAENWPSLNTSDGEPLSKFFWGFTFGAALDWGMVGPIIEREKIGVTFGAAGNEWHAMVLAKGVLSVKWHLTGPTPLVAAMRSYVASKYGDEVPDE